VLHTLRHPYVVLYLGVSFDKYNHYYMVTEYVSKGSLFHILHKKNIMLSEMKAFTIAKQIGKLSLTFSNRNELPPSTEYFTLRFEKPEYFDQRRLVC
jgi:serine/threonine protein kinase